MPDEFVAPASHGQEMLWLDSQLKPDPALYNLVPVLDLPGDLDVAGVTRILSVVVDRHEVLRTCLQLREERLVQVVSRRLEVAPPVTDLAGLAAGEQERRLAEIRRAEVAQPFRLDVAPLWRARLLRLDSRWQLVFPVHHTVFDGSSVAVLRAELTELAEAARQRREPRLPTLEIQYADYAAWQRNLVSGPDGDQQLAYWRQQLADAPAVHALPLDHPRPSLPADPGADLLFDLPAGTGAAAESLGRRYGASELMVLFTAYVAMLVRAGAAPDVVVGALATGRDRAELRPLLGMFVHTLVIRVDASGDPTFAELVARVRDRMFEAWEHQDIPFQTLVKQLVPQRETGVRPLFQLGFNRLKGLDRGRCHGFARDELILVLADDCGRMEYRTDLFDRTTVERWVQRYLRILERALRDPQVRISRLGDDATAEGSEPVAPQPAPAWQAATAPSGGSYPAAGLRQLPLSFAQERLWFLDRLSPGEPVYNMPIAVRVQGPLRIDVLQRAVDALVARHEVLRTTIAEVDGEPVQLVAPAAPVAVSVEDLSAVAEPGRLSLARQVTAAEARAPFDLSTGPLMRIKLLRLADEDHFLLLTLHHVVADAWSLGILSTDLNELYGAFLAGRQPRLPELAIQYGDYARWQREQDTGAELDRQLSYWTRELADAPALLELPTERPRPAEQTSNGGHYTFSLPSTLSSALERLGNETDSTGFMIMLAALQATAARFSGQSDVVVGTPVAGRSRSELEPMIGLFVNPLALRARLDDNPTFRQLLGRAREATLDGLSNQELPFEKLVEVLQPERSLRHSPIFQIQLIFQNAPSTPMRLPGLELSSEARHTGTAKFDLTMEVRSRPGAPVAVALEFNADLFSAAWAERFAGCLTALLDGAVDNPDAGVFDLDLLPPAQRAQVLSAPNDTAAPVPVNCIVETLVGALAEPGSEVVVGGRTTGTDDLAQWSARLATVLRGHGVGPDTLVGLCVDRSVAMVAGLLGGWCAGGAYVPLDPAFPPERLRMMVADSGLGVIVTHSSLRAMVVELAGGGVEVVCVDSAEVAAAPPQPRPAALRGDNLAYVIYTSGSTGWPKGVQVPHRAVVNLLSSFRESLELDRTDTFVAVTTLSFDIAVLELLLPLLCGSRLVIAEQQQAADPRALRRLIADVDATVMQATPATWRMLLASGDLPAGLRTRLCGGEALPRELADDLCAPGATVWNVYGPTETTVWSAAGTVAASPAPIEIGPPVANTQLYVLDRRLLPVPVGVVGEVYVGGLGVTRGYQRAPAMTAARYLPDPYRSSAGARMYRTGDLARRRPDGALELLGRADNQVKVRGFRIETGEIETVLGAHPSVREAVVTADTSAGETRLVGYLVPTAADATPAQLWALLRPHLRQSLPDYMLPATLMVIPELPLTPNGKVDRLALPAPQWAATSAVEYVAPRTEVERQLADTWAGLLRATAPIGVHDDFFGLGGHSLTATQLIARTRTQFGAQLSLRELFGGPTIAELATAIVAHPDYGHPAAEVTAPIAAAASAAASAGASSAAEGRNLDQLGELSDGAIEELLEAALRERHARRGRNEPQSYPLAPYQRRLWFLQQLSPDEPTYTIPAVRSVTGPIRPDLVRRAYDALVQRHAALRTTFTLVDEEPTQVVAPQGTVDFATADLSDGAPGDPTARAHRVVADELRRPFDLANGPVLRVRLLRLADNDHLLLLNAHHLAVDDRSVGVLWTEFARLYREYADGVPAELPALSTQYGQYAAWLAEPPQREQIRDQLDYWTAQLAGAPALLELPTDRPRPPTQTYNPGTYEFSLSAEASRAVLSLSRRDRSTPFPLLLAVFQILLARYTGAPEVVVGSPVTRRPTEDLERVVGLFVNTVAIRTDLSTNPTVDELLAVVRERCLAALSHADAPFEQVAKALRPQRSASYPPVFQVMFVLNDAPAPVDLVPGGTGTVLAPSPVSARVPAARFDLTLLVRREGDRFSGWFDYNADLFDEPTIARMSRHLAAVVEAVVAGGDQRVWDIPLLAGEERSELVAAGDGGHRGYPAAFVTDLVAAAAAAAPDAAAVLAGPDRISYADLERRANRLAHRLCRLGVKPEGRVAVALPAGPEALVAVLAILRAGGAYLPLDPTHPAQRLGWILADAAAEIVVTTGEYADRFTGFSGRVVLLDDGATAPTPTKTGEAAAPAGVAEAAPPVVALHPLHPAYVIYTSGSTGAPKGVVVPHAALRNLALAFADIHGFGREDRLLMVPPLSFDASVGDIFPALVTGAALVLHPEPATLAGKDLLRLCAEQGVTVVDAPAALWQQWVEDLGPGDLTADCPLTQVMVGGGSVPVEKLRAWARATGSAVTLVNHYGPTEATVCATTYTTVDGAELDETAQVPIGAPVPHVRCYVLDRYGRLTPRGVAGELYIGGAGVARGYLGRPGLTAERFVPDPLGAEPGGRLYRTGDRARWGARGQLEFLGRADEQVKIRGYRVELGEVEAAMVAHPSVREAAVLGYGEGTAGLVGYVVAQPTDDVSSAQLREYLRERLPEYLVPSAFVLLEAMPLTAHGKVDHKALPAPAAGFAADRPEYEAPATATEVALAGVWAGVLQLDIAIGRRDSFFGLGGHSLLAVAAVTRIRTAVGAQVPVRLLFQAETLADSAALIDEHLGIRPDPAGAAGPAGTPASGPDLRADAVLPDDVCADLAPYHAGDRLAKVLLTGATGFLGAFLLDDLLRHGAGTVYCLVRAASAEAGAARIEGNLRKLELWRPEYAGRIVPIGGDLEQPRLGWTAERFDALAADLDAIYHNGGLVNFLHPYERLKPANVGGTLEVLRLAGRRRTSAVHFVSTLAVFLADAYRGGHVSESDQPDDPDGLRSGYNQSKWVADALVRAAGERGLPVTVHRPARVTGDSRTGVSNPDDYLSKLLKTFVQMGSVPLWEGEADMSPVDHVSATIGHISRQREALGRGFHFFNHATITYDEVAVAMRRAGFRARRAPYPEWRSELLRRVEDGEEVALGLFTAMLPEAESPSTAPAFDCTQAERYAALADAACPPADGELLRRYLDFFVRSGVLAAPAAAPPRASWRAGG